MFKEKQANLHRWPRTRLYQRSTSRWARVTAVLCLVLGAFHWISVIHTHRKALIAKFSPTIFTHLTPWDSSTLADTHWRWNETGDFAWGSYSRREIWANRHEWKRLGSGSEGEAFTYNGTVIKVYKEAKFPFRNCVPDAPLELRWPTEIEASLLLGGMAGDESQRDGEFLPVTDYFMSPSEEGEARWHFLTPFLASGSLVRLAGHLHHSGHAYTARDLDILYRPSLERLFEALDRMHNRHGLCHDDIKPDNIFLSGKGSLGKVDETLDMTKDWILADLGNAREPDHPYHSSILWSRLNNNLSNCRVNDVVRLVKSYVLFLRAAVDDGGAFDQQFFQGREPWAKLFWTIVDGVNSDAVSAVSARVVSTALDPSLEDHNDTLVHGRDPQGVWNPVKRLLMSRDEVISRAVDDQLRISAADSVARLKGLAFLLGVPVGECQVER
ncbi:uncharacterized protein NECHADRAFT_101921 [Fusarium vanettenii 77-13-4]|uniref:Protein kinase domain-containing protein n=1 Tax=Fusarium vanettenii (strain ATCC MYA-4622 / CBS 123669 / FGSC 9596 / NRRL 45880 / 77-13-4) TaxID=660122 RepID=C7Z1Y5_FUSV7|nr:uncharacterized protein NECHADRAFT_101921 [Fusarium vanettenii 77-13-4]EEU42081.1 hypothetical protein NECHADRAFT_101921 [Fusarium vanettenii 77-13-4]